MGACQCYNENNEEEAANIESFSSDKHLEEAENLLGNDSCQFQLKLDEKDLDLVPLQAALRGYISRGSTEPELPHLKSLNKIDFSLLTPKAAEVRESLDRYPYPSDLPASASWQELSPLIHLGHYVGQLNSKGQLSGFGCLYTGEEGLMEGYWKKGRLHESGRKVFPNGDVYQGDFYYGKAQGKGKLVYYRKLIYQGEFFDDNPHGNGREISPDGTEYVGEYCQGNKHGKGKFIWKDGSWYHGDFNKGLIDGEGCYVWSNGREYNGQWKNNKMHGKGTFKWQDGRYYHGQYWMDKKEGFGVFVWKNGKCYEGEWRDGLQHGRGKLTNSSGKVREGVWIAGKYTK